MKQRLLVVDLTQPDELVENRSSIPQVGIWWASSERLVAVFEDLDDADQVGEFLDSTLQHQREWKRVAAEFGRNTTEEYFAVPRGRVLLRCRNRKGVIYHGNATGAETLLIIAQVFGLEKWQARIDEHYLVGEAVDGLFEDWDEEE